MSGPYSIDPQDLVTATRGLSRDYDTYHASSRTAGVDMYALLPEASHYDLPHYTDSGVHVAADGTRRPYFITRVNSGRFDSAKRPIRSQIAWFPPVSVEEAQQWRIPSDWGDQAVRNLQPQYEALHTINSPSGDAFRAASYNAFKNATPFELQGDHDFAFAETRRHPPATPRVPSGPPKAPAFAAPAASRRGLKRGLYGLGAAAALGGLGYAGYKALQPESPRPSVKVAAATALQPHQQRVVDRLQQDDQPGLVAIHGLGSGKTLTSIAAADALGRSTHAIVPASLQANYAKELTKHKAEVTPDVSTLQGVTRRGGLPSTDEDFLIVDEAHRLREPGTKAYQTVRDIPAAKRLLLTASPTYNRPSDIAALVNVAAGQRVLPADQREFEARYVGEQRVDPGFMARVFRGIQPGSRPVLKNQKELGEILQKWTDYHENPTDTADFPSRIDETIEVPMSAPQQDVYKTITGKAPAWVQYKIRKGLPPSKAESKDLNAFLTGARQAQLSPGVFQQGGAPEGSATKQQAAFDRFRAALEKNPQHRAVVYSNYLDAGLSPYRQLLDKHEIPYAAFTGDMKAQERAQAVRDYNEGKLRALLVSSAGGEGLDLKGTRQMQILEPHFNQEKLKQVIGRGIRYQSHADLPEDQRQVAVEQYLSTMPKRTGLKKFFLGDADTTADQYLHQMSQDKEQLNQQVHALLRRDAQ